MELYFGYATGIIMGVISLGVIHQIWINYKNQRIDISWLLIIGVIILSIVRGLYTALFLDSLFIAIPDGVGLISFSILLYQKIKYKSKKPDSD